MLSVNTNPGAQVALQNLNSINKDLEATQNRISTGLKVSSAKDDGGAFAIAQGLRADVASFGAVQNSLSRVTSTVDTALAAGEAVSDLLIELKSKALAASDASLDSSSRTALNEDFTALRDQITSVVSNASFNDVNLLNGSTASVQALANADGSAQITVLDEDLTLSGSVVTISGSTQINTASAASGAVSALETSIANVNASLARLGTASKALDIQSEFVTKLSDEAEKGIGNLVDADLAKESARLTALQTQQQLGAQALSIANQAPNSILSLFR